MTPGFFSTDLLVILAVCIVLALAALIVWIRARRSSGRRDAAATGLDDDVTGLASQLKYPQPSAPSPAKTGTEAPAPALSTEFGSPDIGLTRRCKDITASLKALATKYSLTELTLATDDGLVVGTSAERDVQNDAVKYSQTARNQTPPDEPDITIFELTHGESHLIGIIRAPRGISLDREQQIREDTKVILQWWL